MQVNYYVISSILSVKSSCKVKKDYFGVILNFHLLFKMQID